jgi:hypothetical protein
LASQAPSQVGPYLPWDQAQQDGLHAGQVPVPQPYANFYTGQVQASRPHPMYFNQIQAPQPHPIYTNQIQMPQPHALYATQLQAPQAMRTQNFAETIHFMGYPPSAPLQLMSLPFGYNLATVTQSVNQGPFDQYQLYQSATTSYRDAATQTSDNEAGLPGDRFQVVDSETEMGDEDEGKDVEDEDEDADGDQDEYTDDSEYADEDEDIDEDEDEYEDGDEA